MPADQSPRHHMQACHVQRPIGCPWLLPQTHQSCLKLGLKSCCQLLLSYAQLASGTCRMMWQSQPVQHLALGSRRQRTVLFR